MISLNVPGSKSITNRVLLLAALSSEKSIFKNVLASDDTRVMISALKKLGVRIEKKGVHYEVYGGELHVTRSPLYCGNAGTAMRFLSAVLAAHPFESILTGDLRMQQRPIKDLLEALGALGAQVKSLSKNGFPPVKIRGPFTSSECTLKGNVSSQFLSGLLIAAPLSAKNIRIKISGELVSKPYVDMTIVMMKKFGVMVTRKGYKEFAIKGGQKYRAAGLTIEGDASSASYFWGISALTGEKIEVKNAPKKSLQADAISHSIIEKFFSKNGRKIKFILNCSNFPDSAMTLAVLAALRRGVTTLTGLSNLRVKESDRLRALANELKKIGCRAQETADGLIIHGNPENLHGADINTYHDHRMAMCFGMLSFVVPGITIENPQCVKKTYPDFWKDMAAVKKQFQRKNIVLTGMRGTGKSVLGKALAARLKRPFIDLDELIEKKAGQSISHIVEQKGWAYFRKLESDAVKSVASLKGHVLSTGGGTVTFSQNARLLKKNSKVIFLESTLKTLQKNLRGKKDRPALTKNAHFIAELKKVYMKRKKIYHKVADAKIDVSKITSNRKNDLRTKTELLYKSVLRLGLI